MKRAGMDGEYVDTTEGGLAGPVPLNVMAKSVVSGALGQDPYSDKAYPVSAEKSSTWAYYGAIFIVLVGSSVLLLYNMLPKGSIERALKGDLGVYMQYNEDKPTLAAGANPRDPNWDRGFASRQAAAQGAVMHTQTVPVPATQTMPMAPPAASVLV